VLDHFVVISNKDLLSYSDILLYTEKVMANTDIDGVFVDPYNSLRIDLGQSSLSSHEYHYEAASEFLKLSKNRNVAIWVKFTVRCKPRTHTQGARLRFMSER